MPPLHSRGSPTPSAGSKIRSGCITTTFSGAQKRAEMLRHPCILGGPHRQARGAKSTVTASPLLSRGPKRGRKCYATLAFLGVPKANCREQKQKWLPHHYFLGGPKEGGNATSPLHSRGSPTPSAGSKIRSGCLTLTFSEPQKRAEMLRHPCILWGPLRQAHGAKSEVAASPLLSRGPKKGRKCYVTPALSGVPNAKRRGQIQKWLPHPYFLGGPEEGGNGMSPLHCPGSPTASAGGETRGGCLNPTFSGAPKRAEMLHHPCILMGSPTPSAKGKFRSGCLTPPFSGAQKRAEMLCHPCIVQGPQRQAQGAKSEVAASPLLSRRPKRGRKCYVTPAFSGVPNTKVGEQNQQWLPHPYFVGGPREGGNATSPRHSWGSPTPSAGSNMRSGCLNPTLWDAQKRAEMVCHPCIVRGPQRQAQGAKSEVVASPLLSRGPTRGQKCYVTPAFSGHPNANRGKQDQKWLPHPCFLGGPKEG